MGTVDGGKRSGKVMAGRHSRWWWEATVDDRFVKVGISTWVHYMMAGSGDRKEQ